MARLGKNCQAVLVGWPRRQRHGGVVAGVKSSTGDEAGCGDRRLVGFGLRLDVRPEKKA